MDGNFIHARWTVTCRPFLLSGSSSETGSRLGESHPDVLAFNQLIMHTMQPNSNLAPLESQLNPCKDILKHIKTGKRICQISRGIKWKACLSVVYETLPGKKFYISIIYVWISVSQSQYVWLSLNERLWMKRAVRAKMTILQLKACNSAASF